ncbi:cyclin-dependent kinase 20 isoform X5 [Canis lupus baileyi]|uniref:cyclin-dependent kinase 20 isoform X5 n=1 Tax=Canis lupus familiaris TaxID=9615 RepID=UPI0006B3D94C|nr:cyclin-dependent kinase 20 isoform X5 [Canis lupus familiaris]XP_038511362.1 cyclin-dependent kinase 20 isoform X5 [Canis lupus familiaris]|eukprot:XP_013973482.1 cyclin-dependent kinase 20 isoform X4 [Canis lupus familiaris]
MDQYCILGRIGEGAHGVVFKAKHVETGEIVALKKVALRRLEDGIPNQALREIKALQEIEDNQHVVQLKAVFPHGAGFVLAFEFMLSDLAEVVRHAQRPLVQAQVKSYLQMLLKGVAFCHANNIVHRDLKPANLLISASGQLKIADFGLARVFSPDGSRLYTHQVATRWYRAPELLYGARQYDQGVDLWAVGCILGELLNGSPLFPGENDIEQLCCVLRILGTPSPQVWPVCRSSWRSRSCPITTRSPSRSRRLCPWRRCCPMRLPRPWTCWGGSSSTPHTSAFLPPRSGMRFQGPKNCGGGIDELAYISTNECRFDGQEKSVVCTVSSDSTVRAWDVQEGTEIWSSPLQPAALVNLAAYPRLQLVVTVDKQGLIKTWKAENGREWASFSLPTSSSALQACDHPETPFLLVASAEGVMYTLTVPQLQLLSWTSVFPSSPTSLLCSPDSQWVFASTQDSDLGPKVFYTQSLRCVVEDEPPVSSTLPVLLTSRACWAPDETARLMVMHRNSDNMRLAITTYELGTKQSQKGVDAVVQQIASFLLPDNMMPPHLMKGHGSQVVLLVSGLELVLFTIQGLQLAAFQDHQKPITSMWVDQSRVLTASFDLSLRVYVWNKENKFPVLKSCYHLLGGSHRWASGFTHVESDSMSIVGIEARSIGTSILRSYCFNVQHGSDDCVD